MFYSQFILAKKGPLGTIWIAAHLERKLRKNQVADTDIGVSVDSILFPEVPIALRLSSHLLLGVVRIYSRKVNYLFHDCSEALLKVKQAFRSTVVDLPPEESTAPYHSITLPETFDLDGFELPDSALLSGNFDDRHVSTREQITLQDTFDGAGYSTSQFGLDEQFGDGDGSQIRLDLDEELFLDNNLTVQHASVSLVSENSDQVQGASNLTKMDVDEDPHRYNEVRNSEASKNLSEVLCDDRGKHIISNVDHSYKNDSSHPLIFNIQTPDLNEVFLPEDDIGGPSAISHGTGLNCAALDPSSPEFNGSAYFPSTLGLLEEALPISAQELPVSDSQKNSEYADLDGSKLDKLTNEEVGRPDATDHDLMHVSSSSPKLTDLAQSSCFLTSVSVPISDSQKDSEYVDLEDKKLEKPTNQEVARSDSTINDPRHVASSSPKMTDLAQSTCSLTSVLAESEPDAGASQRSTEVLISPDPMNEISHVQDEWENLGSGHTVPVMPTPLSISTETTIDLQASLLGGIPLEATNNSSLVHVESANRRLEDIPQVLPSSTLVSTEAIPHSVVIKGPDETTAASPVVLSESAAKTLDTLHDGFTFNEVSKHPFSMESSLVPEVSSGIFDISLQNSTRLSNPDKGHVNDPDSYHKTNLSALSSDFHLRSCTSESKQSSFISQGVNNITESAPIVSFRDSPCSLATPLAGQDLNYRGFSVGLQGGLNLAFSTDTNTVVQHANSVFLGSTSHVNNPLDLSSNYMTHVQSGHMNCFSSSEFSGPERMLFAPSGNLDLPNDLGQQSTEKAFTESDGSVNRISSLSGHKRRLTDSTLDLQNGLTPKISGMPRKKRNNDYVPNDDDILASILVGRTPALRMGPTPPVPKPTTLKRPHLTPKVGLPKRRKVQLDDTVVLHAEAIRQQLINTEDIRRMRKKAPCTPPDIWRIHKFFLEDDTFNDSIFTGISEELISLIARRYDLLRNVHSQISEHQSILDASKGPEYFKTSEFARHTDVGETAVQSEVMLDRVEVQGQSNTSEPMDTQSCPITVTVGAQHILESPLSLDHKEQSGNTVAIAEPDVLGNSEVELVTCVASNSRDECEVPTDERIEEKCDDMRVDPQQDSLDEMFHTSHERREINTNLHVADCTLEDFTSVDQAGGGKVVSENELAEANNDSSVRAEDLSIATAKEASVAAENMGVDLVNHANLKNPEVAPANVDAVDNDGSILNRSVLEVDPVLPADSSSVIQYSEPLVPDLTVGGGEPTTTHCQVMKKSEGGQIMAGNETLIDAEKPTSGFPCMEGPNMRSFLIPSTTESERVPSAVDENSCMNIECGLDVESPHTEFAATRESSDFCSAIDDIDTDFLNVDDDVEYDEEMNDDVPNMDEAQSLENSGWSSRTRGVARYLKNLFDEESGRGRKSFAIDNLLAGKTRREASRMFFETLVLKTKDYIHVEQENPLENINIKPRIKLLKSEF